MHERNDQEIFIAIIFFMTPYEKFFQLHHQEQPLLIGNVWDVMSAKIFEQKGFKAVATSSAALARTMGYEDGEQIPFELMLKMVERIINNITIPLSVDIEAGFSRSIEGIIENLEKLYELGVVGFNLEDSHRNETRYLQCEDDFARIISSIKEYFENKNMNMFVNARTDAYVLKLSNAFDETIKRIRVYEKAGASGIFVPYLTDKSEIEKVVQSTKLPVNVFATPGLPSFDELAQLGIKRISMATWPHRAMLRSLESIIEKISEERSFKSLY